MYRICLLKYYKIIMKEIKDINKQTGISYLCVRKLNLEKISILKLIYRINKNPIKTSQGFCRLR